MSERNSYAEGTPSWVDLSAIDPAGARDFYGSLLGWTFDIGGPDVGGYTMCLLNGKSVAGIMERQDESMPSVWSTYIDTDDIDRTTAKITEAGGQVIIEPMDVMDLGRMGFAIDPTGAAFGLWQAGTHVGAAVVNEPGALSWNELNTRDGAAANTFYEKVFGYTFEQVGDGEKFDYTTYNVAGNPVAGRMQMNDADWPAEVPAHWATYFAVADADAATALVAAKGGRVLRGPTDTPFGRLAGCLDPWGAPFSLIKLPAAQ
jgi:predicted enzyme related to lactoylglutathione lyase